MSAFSILLSYLLYTALLFVIMFITTRKANNQSFFNGNKKSPWFVVAYGMISASLSGVTFMSVPGLVINSKFSYMIIVFGYLFGYLAIIFVLLPLYYKLNLTSIYSYLKIRFGFWTYKTGAFYFLVSRSIGASFRMFLVVNVLQIFVFDVWGIPFSVTLFVFLLFLLLYTIKGGIKTIIWTDTLQTTFMLASLVLALYFLSKALGMNFSELFDTIRQKEYSQMIYSDWNHPRNVIKQFISGIFITIVMTGLDQDMMQKNLSCRSLKEAQKNMFTYSVAFIPINLLFLSLGVVLFIFANQHGITYSESTDLLFPTIALNHLGPVMGIIFLIGLMAAAYSSADGALTALTTSFCIDFLNFETNKTLTEKRKSKIRYIVFIAFAIFTYFLIMLFKAINDTAVLNQLFTIAGYTYGPLLGMFVFGLYTKRGIKDIWVPLVSVLAPLLSYLIAVNSKIWFNGYVFGFELLLVNGLLTIIGFAVISKKIPRK